AVIHPVVPTAAVAVALTVCPAIRMPALFPVFYPHPMFLPPGRPDAPGGRGHFFFLWDTDKGKVIASVIGYRIGRIVAVQIHDVGSDGAVGWAAALDSDPDGADAGLIRRMQLYPDQLTVSLRVIDIADRIGIALDDKLHGD